MDRFRGAVWTCLGALLWTVGDARAQPAAPERVVIEYVAPVEPVHKPLYDLLREHQALERVRGVLTRVRWPQPLRVELRGCEGVSNAWYEEAKVTVCYEYLEDVWKRANSTDRPASITRDDAFIGPFAEVFLHEVSHALFHMLQVPLLGREEDAADQLAAYHMLQLPKDTKRGMILGAAWAYASELKVRHARDLHKRRLKVARLSEFADEHGTPAQRLYNLLCIAYGSDQELFAEVVDKGFLPQERADICEDEYRQIEFAHRTLVAPHVDAHR